MISGGLGFTVPFVSTRQNFYIPWMSCDGRKQEAILMGGGGGRGERGGGQREGESMGTFRDQAERD